MVLLRYLKSNQMNPKMKAALSTVFSLNCDTSSDKDSINIIKGLDNILLL